MRQFFPLVLVCITLTGCASHSTVAPLGGGKYMLSKQAATGFPGLGNMKAELLQEGEKKCQSMGKEFEAIDSKETQPPYVFGNYPRAEITFVCK